MYTTNDMGGSSPCIARVLLLCQFLCSTVLLAFSPMSYTTLHNTRYAHTAAGRQWSIQPEINMISKPYFVDFSTEHTRTQSRDNAADSIPTSRNDDLNKKSCWGKTAIIAGGTGYIGRACVRECVARGYNTIALVRNADRASEDNALTGAILVECDVTNEMEVQNLFTEIANGKHSRSASTTVATNKSERRTGNSQVPSVDIVMSCLASPSGIEKEVYAIDYQATLNLLNAGRDPSVKARHFVLLSAFCCRNPILKLQQAKLKFEQKLSEQSDMTYSIVRPTAFFKSVSGQLESILEGNAYVLFGDGAVTHCNPIAEEELAEYMIDSSLEEYKEQRWGKVLNVGGPDAPLSNKMLGEMMFKAINKPAKFVYVPTEIFDFSISIIEFIAKTWPSQKWEDVLETSKIGKYYAVEDMLTTKEEEKYGKIGMMDHFEKIATNGQDPFTPVRATAVISKTLEALPAVSISLPFLGLVSKPELVQNVVSSNSLKDLPLLVAGLSDSNVIS